MQIVENKGFVEATKMTDLKILIAFISCVLGAASHFYPIPFPQNKLLIAFCIVGYMICTTLYYLIERKYEKDAFFIAKDHKVSITYKTNIQLNSLKAAKEVRFCSVIEPNDHHYNFKIERVMKNGETISYDLQYPVNEFYDSLGYLHRYKVKSMFDDHLAKFISKK